MAYSSIFRWLWRRPLEREISADLPEELVREILLRLPVNSIIRLRRVCKAWYSLITNPNFIYAHVANTLGASPTSRFFLHHHIRYKHTKSSLLFFDARNHLHSSPLDLPFRFEALGCCRGIVCTVRLEFDCSFQFILCNPFTGNSLSIPRPNLTVKYSVQPFLSGFGYNDSTKDFKILFLIEHWDSIWECQIYSLNSNTWRSVTAPIPSIVDGHGLRPSIFVNGGLHWVVDAFILVFDLEEEAFSRISLPEYVNPERFMLGVRTFGESSISVICRTILGDKSDIWVMREYGAVDSWTKLATVGEQTRGRSEVLGFVNNDEVLIKFQSGYIALQTLDGILVKHVECEEEDWRLRLPSSMLYDYVPSLLLLGKKNNSGARSWVSKIFKAN